MHPGDDGNRMPRREQSRFISASQPYAQQWHAVARDGTAGTTMADNLWRTAMQRDLGLHLSILKPTLVALSALGERVDYFGDAAINGGETDADGRRLSANTNRRHNNALRGWHDAIAAVSTTQTVLGDKDNKAKTKQFNDYNDGHVVDVAEIAAGENGEIR